MSGVSGSSAGTLRSGELLVGIAPPPGLPRLDRPHDDVARRGGVGPGVSHGRGVAAADLAAGQALAQVYPGGCEPHALHARAPGGWPHGPDEPEVRVGTDGRWGGHDALV